MKNFLLCGEAISRQLAREKLIMMSSWGGLHYYYSVTSDVYHAIDYDGLRRFGTFSDCGSVKET